MFEERRQRAMRIIKGLLEKKLERGATPSEAAAATAKVQELLERYQLSMFDVEKQEIKDEMGVKVYDTGRKNANPGEISLAAAVATGYDCKLVIEKYPSSRYVFLGYQSDTEVAEYVFTYLFRTLANMAENEGRKCGAFKQKLVRYRNNFLMGAAGVIRQRMINDKKVRQNVPTQSPTVETKEPSQPKVAGTSLALLKQPKVEEFVKQKYARLVSRPESKVRYNANAIDAGRKAGASIELRKGINQEERMLLK